MPITVNGVEITDATILAEMRRHPAPSRELAEYSAKLELVARELLSQEAARLGIVGVDEDARIEALIQRETGNHPSRNKRDRAISRYLALLMGRASIDGIDPVDAGSPPMR